MKLYFVASAVLVAQSSAFQGIRQSSERLSTTQLTMDRRGFGSAIVGAASAGLLTGLSPPAVNAQVFFDPAMYGDQELRVGTVDSVRERTRRAILQNPKLAPSFYQLAMLDGLSYDAAEAKYGPNGGVIYSVLPVKTIPNTSRACKALPPS